MGSRLALLMCLNLFIFFTTVNCSRPQKHHSGNHHKMAHLRPRTHSHPMMVNSTGVHILDESNCPRDAVKMGVCVSLLAALLNIQAGLPPKHPCCSAMFGIMDLEAAICLCTTMKASFLGITIDMPIKMTLLLNFCGRPVPKGFICA